MKRFQCGNCGQVVDVPQGVSKQPNCPRCGAPAAMIHRLNKGPLGGRRDRGGGLPWRHSSPQPSPFFQPQAPD